MSASEDEGPEPKRRRGVTHQSSYKRYKIRDARVKGEAYVNYKNNLVPQKVKPEGITCICSYKCRIHIDQILIDDTWQKFYSLQSKDLQDTYLQTLVEVVDVKRRRRKVQECQMGNEDGSVDVDEPPPVKRNVSYVYNLKVNGELRVVCKACFMQIHGISRDRLARICQLLRINETPKDKRGKSKSGNVKSGEICVRIHEHISKFDVKETHYGGKPKKYLDANLNIKLMHAMFISENDDLKNEVNYNYYYNYYKENFGYSFGRPQVDVCSVCESLNAKLKDRALNENAKRAASAELLIHKRRAKKFYTSMKAASENKDEDTCCLCFDFMQNLPLPNIPVQEIFYMRQLWVNVFSIHDLKTNKSKIYMYHEGGANKSPDEVCSMILNYINTEVPNTVKHLILFSDGPSGQNKNHTVSRFLMNLCDRGMFNTITHKFPVRGHSFSACDRDFGSIKRVLRKLDRIYTPEQYAELVLRASTNNRFKVHKLTTPEVLSFKTWWPAYYKKTAYSVETSTRATPASKRQSFKISSYRHFFYNAEAKGRVVVSEFIDSPVTSTFSLLKTREPPNLPVEPAYPDGKVSYIFILTCLSFLLFLFCLSQKFKNSTF